MSRLMRAGAPTAFFLAVALLIAACAALPQLRDNRDRLAAGEVLFTQTVLTAHRLRQDGIIAPGSDLEKSLTATFLAARSSLDAAGAAIAGGNDAAAGVALDTASRLIEQARAELRKSQGAGT